MGCENREICKYVNKETPEPMQSEQLEKLAIALSKAQKEMQPPARNKTVKVSLKSGGSYTYQYADMDAVVESCKTALGDNGLAVIQPLNTGDKDDFVETVLLHSSGQWIKSRFKIPGITNNMQDRGGLITYARRYAYMAMLGIAPEDNDANDALGKDAKIEQGKPKPKGTPKGKGQPKNAPQKPSGAAKGEEETESIRQWSLQPRLDKLNACDSLPHLENAFELYKNGITCEGEYSVYCQTKENRAKEIKAMLKEKSGTKDADKELAKLKGQAWDKIQQQLKWKNEELYKTCLELTKDKHKTPNYMEKDDLLKLNELLDKKISEKEGTSF